MADTTNAEASGQPEIKGWAKLKSRILAENIEIAMWFCRLLTIYFTFSFFIPIFANPYNVYYKALMANAATSALRLHTRLPRVTFSREFLQQLAMEDSCHYLLFSFIFLFVTPVGLALTPIAMFALLHFARYSQIMLDDLGQNSCWPARLMISLVEFQTYNLLRFIAFVEIILMPFTVVLILLGKAGLITPFVYYQFLQARYCSRRNRHTRAMFRDLRMMLEHTAAKPGMPGFVRTVLMTVITVTLRLAPPLPPDVQ